MDDEAAVPRDGEDEVTPQLSDTQSFSVDGTELVTQEFMVRDQLEQDRMRMEKKVSATNEKIEQHRLRKSWLVYIVCYSYICLFMLLVYFHVLIMCLCVFCFPVLDLSLMVHQNLVQNLAFQSSFLFASPLAPNKGVMLLI
jgi:hypothetical protein